MKVLEMPIADLVATLKETGRRAGIRPRTSLSLPHLQLDQWPPAAFCKELIERSLRIPDVHSKQSRMAAPTSLALCLPDSVAIGPREAFIDDHEFCFLHSLPEGNIHLTLPESVRELALRLGWAEQHPAARAGLMPPTLVMLYAPRHRGELEVALDLIQISCRFAKGLLQNFRLDQPQMEIGDEQTGGGVLL